MERQSVLKKHCSSDLDCLISFSNTRTQDSLEKWLILRQGKIPYKMSLEHLVGPESDEVFKKQNDVGMPKGTGDSLKESPVDKGETI